MPRRAKIKQRARSRPKENYKIQNTLIVLLAFIIGSAGTLAITTPNIIDTDPASYIIVTMLMSLLFIIFTMKSDIVPKRKSRDLIYAGLVLLFYVVLISYSRGALSTGFISYRVDALLMPLLLLGIVIAVMGSDSIKTYAPVLVYLLFASPLLLLPLLSLNGALALLSAKIVYPIVKLMGVPAVRDGLKIVTSSGASLEIAQACVPIGTFVALVMLLIPVAYLCEGSLGKRTLWVACGAVLLFILNIIRMSIISFAWAFYGVGGFAGAFHQSGGEIIFLLDIVVMVLLLKKFGLKLNLGSNWSAGVKSLADLSYIGKTIVPIAAALIIALVSLYLSFGYLGALNMPATYFNSTTIQNQTYLTLERDVFTTLNTSRVTYSYLGATNSSMLFELGPTTDPGNSTYMVVSFYPRQEPGGNVFNYSSKSPKSAYIMRNGVTLSSLYETSYGTSFLVNYFSRPYLTQQGAISANFEFFSNAQSHLTTLCSPTPPPPSPIYLNTVIFNTLNGQVASPKPAMCYASQIAASAT